MAYPVVSPRRFNSQDFRPWSFGLALAATGFLLLLQYLLQAAAGRIITAFALGHPAGLLLLCLPPLAGAGLASFMVMKWKGLGWVDSLRFMGFKRPGGRRVLLGLLLSAPVLGGYFLSARHFEALGIPVSFFPEWPYLLVLFTVSAGFYEELVFRGFLFQFLRAGRPFPLAASLASFLWVLSHWGNSLTGANIRLLFPGVIVFLLGIAGAYVFEKSGNALWSWMIVHLAVDSIGLVNIGNTGLFRAPVGHAMAYYFAGEALCVVLAFPLANWFWPDPP